MSNDWLRAALQSFPLTEVVEDYLLGRGVREDTIRSEGVVTWQLLPEPSPDKNFRTQCGPRGEKLEGMVAIPVWSPKGSLLGVEARSIYEKRILDFRLPEAKYQPFFIGTRTAMPAIWAGGDVWLVEGFFDKAPLEWAVPPTDAVLATVRAHITPQQLEFLRRFCKGWVRMVYDRDQTGREAVVGKVDPNTGKRSSGALDLLKGVGLKPSDVFYSGGKDPGEIWDHGGVAAIKAAFAKGR